MKPKNVSWRAWHATLVPGDGTAPGVLSTHVAHAHPAGLTVLRPLQVMALQVQLARKGTEESAAATTLQALTYAAGDDPFRRS